MHTDIHSHTRRTLGIEDSNTEWDAMDKDHNGTIEFEEFAVSDSHP